MAHVDIILRKFHFKHEVESRAFFPLDL